MPKMSFWIRYPFYSRLLVWAILPLSMLAGYLIWSLSSSLPLVKGSAAVQGLRAAVLIERDENSIPSIAAKSNLDAYFGLGFVHAQDRLWQMEMNRRIGAGRLSEVLGASALSSDIMMRKLGLYKNAQNIWTALDAESRDIVLAYVAGVNAGISKTKVLPVEFHLVDFRPERWMPEDTLVLLQLMTWKYSSNMGNEIQRFLLAQNIGIDTANYLMPGGPDDMASNFAMGTSAGGVSDSALGLAGDTQKYLGSNSWVVAGSHSASGTPILANDPHLTTPIPSLWYLASVKGGALNAVGATMPGLPFVLIGKNEHITWGLTNAMADTQDVIFEDINPLNKNQYRVGGAYVDMQVSTEEIMVKSEFLRPPNEPERVEVRRTRNGPVLSDVGAPLGNIAYSVRWTGDDDNGGTMRALLMLNYARNWTEFNSALSTYVAPINNFVYADKLGNIGALAPGLFPVRRVGNGSVPVSGSQQAGAWTGFIPYESVPRLWNPPQGYIVAANNKLVADSYPFHVTSDWAPDYRAKRIETQLASLITETKGKVTVQQMKDLQADVRSPAAANGMLKKMRVLRARNEAQRRALLLISEWDGQMAEDSAGATLFTSWTSHLNVIFFERMRKDYARSRGADGLLRQMMRNDNEEFLERLLTVDDKGWCRKVGEGMADTCDDLLYRALDGAIRELTRELGTDEADWRWGRLHKTEYTHFPFSKSKKMPGMPQVEDRALTGFFDRSQSNGGGGNTVNVAPVSFERTTKYMQFVGPMYRQIVDLGAPSSSVFMQGTGQSGNPYSRHYDDLMQRHQQGDYILMDKRKMASSLQLQPVPAKTR